MSQEIEIILALKEWHRNAVEQLRSITNAPEGTNFKAMNIEGEVVDIPKKYMPGIKIGVSIALDLIDQFPITITETNNTQDDE